MGSHLKNLIMVGGASSLGERRPWRRPLLILFMVATAVRCDVSQTCVSAVTKHCGRKPMSNCLECAAAHSTLLQSSCSPADVKHACHTLAPHVKPHPWPQTAKGGHLKHFSSSHTASRDRSDGPFDTSHPATAGSEVNADKTLRELESRLESLRVCKSKTAHAVKRRAIDQQRLDRLQSRLTQRREAMDFMEKSSRELQGEISDTEGRILELKQEETRIQSEIDKDVAKHSSELTSAQSANDHEYHTLRLKLQHEKDLLAVAQRASEATKAKNNKLSKDRDSLEKQVEAAKDRVSKLKLELENVTFATEENRVKAGDLKAQFSHLHAQMTSLRAQRKEEIEKEKGLDQAIRRETEKVDSLKAQLPDVEAMPKDILTRISQFNVAIGNRRDVLVKCHEGTCPTSDGCPQCPPCAVPRSTVMPKPQARKNRLAAKLCPKPSRSSAASASSTADAVLSKLRAEYQPVIGNLDPDDSTLDGDVPSGGGGGGSSSAKAADQGASLEQGLDDQSAFPKLDDN